MRRLFVLRPEPGASATVERAQTMGIDAVAMPLFAIEPIPWSVPDCEEFDGLLLTSANAVRKAGEGLQRVRALPVHAVGEATAEAARAAGLDVVKFGRSDVDELMRSIPPGARLLHICGEHRRTPANSAQTITSIAVYRACALRKPAGLSALAGQVAAIHSPRSAARLAELVPAPMRADVRLAAISKAAADAAGNGWEQIQFAEMPDDTELLALAARLCEKSAPE